MVALSAARVPFRTAPLAVGLVAALVVAEGLVAIVQVAEAIALCAYLCLSMSPTRRARSPNSLWP